MASSPEPIAIVGSGCRFPGGSNSPSALWKLLEKPRDVCGDIPPSRFDVRSFYHKDGSHHGTTNVQRAYLMEEDVSLFDAAFFNISPHEADSMDPQQRLLLETVYEALESGGHSMESLRGTDTAVYVGTMSVDYGDILLRDVETLPKYHATGTSRAIISNRVSYFFDWQGPSLTIDTACSSSLIAVHQGVQALRSGDSRVAVACGTQVILGPEVFVSESSMSMLSPTGRSRMWDAGADGYARGEGVASIVLKRLSDAIADGDHIQCLIRGTGVNQDGRSSGLTVPSSGSQAALIRSTYQKAGLDPQSRPQDKPQFFEAHGTGTQAGDPREAAAICECFGQQSQTLPTPLYVGSIKTIIGHTEGAAGLAGLLKASNMIQNGIIPPNLLFERLNPAVKPHYQGLQIPTSPQPWPELPAGTPRRVSVNSFGFGGANAHAILEEYRQSPAEEVSIATDSQIPVTPFVFSAASEASLVAQIEAYSTYLKTADEPNALDLAWTLRSRRSHLPIKAAFGATSIEQLTSKLDAKIAALKVKSSATLGVRSNPSTTAADHVLGVFTGQGAQWAAMGAQLIVSSPFVRMRLQSLEDSLMTLPRSDRPSWSLQEEMLAGPDTSRIAEAELSQPLCTAVQIILVDLLKAANIRLSAVVGHSSGEIGAAYAAGVLSSHDAIRIAHYRGLFARLAGSQRGDCVQKGSMLAVGTSWEDAQELVQLKAFKKRLAMAAHNSPASVTLSGDADAVVHAKKVFDEEKKFARQLKVDTAYHSHHMVPCSDPYVDALRACEIRANRDREDASCTWYSSVYPGTELGAELDNTYWGDNMTNTVLFAEAVENALAADPQLSAILEVGPHPALKGPVTQILSELRSATSPAIPYSGVLNRGVNDVEAFSDALGFVWTTLGPHSLDLQSYQDTLLGGDSKASRRQQLVVGLPSYQWSHSRTHWHESRRSRRRRRETKAVHEILGVFSPDSTPHNLRWTNILKVSEIPWLEGHFLQGQVIFPAAGYVAMALEATRMYASQLGDAVELLELNNFVIAKPIVFDEDPSAGVETLVTLTAVRQHADDTVTADFSCYTCPSISMGSEQDLALTASGNMRIVLGEPDIDAIPCTFLDTSNMTNVDSERFYSSLSELGYGYAGNFRSMSSLKRRLNQSSFSVDTYPYSDLDSDPYLIHPTTLDVAIQGAMLAYSAPGDGRLWSLHVPTSIDCITVNPQICTSLPTSQCQIPVCTVLDDDTGSVRANIEIFGEDGQNGMIRMEGLAIKPITPASEAHDRRLFSYTKWYVAAPDGSSIESASQPSKIELEVAALCLRMASYYSRKWESEIIEDDWIIATPHCLYLRDYVNQLAKSAAAGENSRHQEWQNDTDEDINTLISRYDKIEIKLLSVVGANMIAAVRERKQRLEDLVPCDLLDELFEHGIGFESSYHLVAQLVNQVTHRYPHAKILEIGAREGAATKVLLGNIGHETSYYTYTDESEDFCNKAAQRFHTQGDRTSFKVLNLDKSPATQGFELNSFDIIIAAHCLQGRASLQIALKNARQLLKPGGYLLLTEITSDWLTRSGGMLCGFAGLWPGTRIDARLNASAWYTSLREAGFGGVDAMLPESTASRWPFTIMAAQAIDDRVSYLRRPLSASTPYAPSLESVAILGTRNLQSTRIAEEVAEYLGGFCDQVNIIEDLPTEEDARYLSPMTTFVNLVDIGSPIFENFSVKQMNGLKRMFNSAKHILWVTAGARVDQPYHSASISFCRSIRHEETHISLNNLNVSQKDLENYHWISREIVEHLLRQHALEEWGDSNDKPLLWSKEHEIDVVDGRLMIPRLVVDTPKDARLNSIKRSISKKTAAIGSHIAISPPGPANETFCLVDEPILSKRNETKGFVTVQSSSLMALNITDDTFLYLIQGTVSGSRKGVIALSCSNSSQVKPVVETILSDAAQNSTADLAILTAAVACELIAMSIVCRLRPGSNMLVHCTSQQFYLAEIVNKRAVAHQVKTTFVCDKSEHIVPSHESALTWVQLSSRSSKHSLSARLCPKQFTHWLDLAVLPIPSDVSELSSRIGQLLTSGCKHICTSDHAQLTSSLAVPVDEQGLLISRLEDAVSSATKMIATSSLTPGAVVPLEQIENIGGTSQFSTVALWPREGDLQVYLQPLNPRKLFSKEKTYLLVGLSGQIGQSIGEWMLSNGAGCVCLTSRNPRVSETWLQSFNGAIKIFSMDVTDLESVTTITKHIRSTCPPIAGVVNGAMVLRDALFSGMSLDEMQTSLGPKIQGSNNLDRVFYEEKLDFFILFSSLACVVGNPGQSNYATANGYLNGLARQRRRRGFAASVIDIGRVAGIGVVETSSKAVVDQLTKFGFLPISETDFHQTFAEAILAGYSDHERDQKEIPAAAVTTGIRTILDDDGMQPIQIPWFKNPFFSHCLSGVKSSSSSIEGGRQASSLVVSEQVSNATSKEEALEIILQCFGAKLHIVLQIPSETPIDRAAPLIELGIDSFVAAELRSWFLKEIKVDIPIFQVAGGASMMDLCQRALDKLPENLIGSTGSGNSPSSKSQPDRSLKPVIKIPSHDEAERANASALGTSNSTEPSSDEISSCDSPLSVSDSFTLPDAKAEASDLQEPASKKFLKSEPLSFGQSRFWFLRHFLEDPTTFNVLMMYQITGRLRISDLERAVRVVASRHEALRTCFVGHPTEVDKASQRVLPMGDSPLHLKLKKITSEEDIETEYSRLKSHVFDLENGDTMRLVLLTRSSSSHYLLINYTHILMDGVSFQIFLSDLEKTYNGRSHELEAPTQFTTFSESQRRALAEGDMNEELSYWRQIFPDGEQPPVLPLLPMARLSARVPMTSFAVHQVIARVDSSLQARIRLLAKAQKSTPFHVYLAAFQALLFRFIDLSHTDDEVDQLTIGIADANRQGSETLNSIGLFLNLLPLRFRRQSNQSFADAIIESRNSTYKALSNSRLPFNVLLDEFKVARSSLHSPFFQAFFDYRQGAQEKHAFGNCQFEVKQWHPGHTAYDITLDVADGIGDADSLVIVRAQKALYDETAANLFLKTYISFLDTLSKDPKMTLEKASLFGNEQISKALDVGRGPLMVSDWPQTLAHRIEQIAAENGTNTALMDGFGHNLTYADMNYRIQAIAEELQNRGVHSGSRVLVFQQAASDWVCSLLAIMRINAVYVPLDINTPIQRLAIIAANCNPRAIVLDDSVAGPAAQLGVPDIEIINVACVQGRPAKPVPVSAQADSPAAILFTSGSTGVPKGLMVTHSGLKNEMEGYTKTWKLGAERVLQQSAFTFDFSSDQIFTGLVNGGMVFVVPSSKRGDPSEITALLQEQSITYTKATPSEYSMWLEYGIENLYMATAWKFAFGGGESLTNSLLSKFQQLRLPNLGLYNSYGPAECSISSTKMAIDYSKFSDTVDRIPCGFPLPNYHTYVVDEQLNPLPIGMPGELCIGGAGVGLGYVNNADLTDAHFISNPFSTSQDKSNGWTRMYRTGDIVHLRDDGVMVFHSRIAGDTEIKLRGIRIDLCDIESNIIAAADGDLLEVVVTLKGQGDKEFLVAYVVFSSTFSQKHADNPAAKKVFLQHLLSQLALPRYMIPAVALPLDHLPLSKHSKVDRMALASMPLPFQELDQGFSGAIEASRENTNYEEELGNIMEHLKLLWNEVLEDQSTHGIKRDLTPSSDFFLVGGNSLLVVRLQRRVHQVFHVATRLSELLNNSTLVQMARKIQQNPDVGNINWVEETELPQIPGSLSLGLSGDAISEPKKDGGKTLLMTGSTGFVASHLLEQLVVSPEIKRIHCVAVRENGEPRTIHSSHKIIPHTGDLTMPFLGLSEGTFASLSRDVDIIFHLGASRSFWDSYHLLKPVNVNPTKELVKMAAARKIPVHYISTMATLPRREESEATFEPPADGSDGYVASRWVSEGILQRAAGELGVPSRVYRFLPFGDGVVPSALAQSVLDEFLQFVDVSGKLPDMEGWEGRLDLIEADQAARWLCESLLKAITETVSSDATCESAVEFVNYQLPVAVDVAELRAHIKQHRANQEGLEPMQGLKWIGKIKKLGFRYLLASQDVTVGSLTGAQGFTSRR